MLVELPVVLRVAYRCPSHQVVEGLHFPLQVAGYSVGQSVMSCSTSSCIQE